MKALWHLVIDSLDFTAPGSFALTACGALCKLQEISGEHYDFSTSGWRDCPPLFMFAGVSMTMKLPHSKHHHSSYYNPLSIASAVTCTVSADTRHFQHHSHDYSL